MAAAGKDKISELLGTIARTTPTASPAASPDTPENAPQKTAKAKTRRAKAGSGKISAAEAPAAGKFSSIYLNTEDQRILRELSVWFAGQGRKINDTLIIRAALRAARTGSDLLAAYDKAVRSDRRYTKR